MATSNSSRDVRLGISVETAGESDLAALGKGLRDLAADGKTLPPAFAETAAAVEKLTAATVESRAVEAAARAEVNAEKAALAAKRDELSRLKASSDAATRSTQEYQQAERALKLALIDGGAALRDRREALAQAAASARVAVAAEQALQREISAAVTAYRQVAAASAAAGNTQAAANEKVTSTLDQLKGQLQSLRNVAALALGGSLVGGLAKDIGETADQYANLSARIKIATGDGAAFQSSLQGVFDVAQRTGAAVDDVGRLFTKLLTAGKQLNLGNADALRLVESITQATALSGESAESSNAAIVQFSQAIASGVLRGEELNSVLEQAPRLARALADGLDVSTGELRKLGEAGAITSQQIIGALQGQSATLQREFEQLPPTIGRAITSISNNWTAYIGQVDKATGASTTAAKAITALGNNLDTLGTLLFSAGKAAAAYAAINLAKTFLANAAAAAASATAKAAETAATQANTAATIANSAAKGANAAATTAGAAASVEAAASAGRLASLLSTIKLVSLVGVLTNLREIGTAIGEGAAKLMGYDKPLRDLEIATKADEQAARANAQAKAELAQKLQLATEKALGLTDQSRKLISTFDDTIKKGGETSDAISKLAKELELGNLDGIRNAGTALDVLGQRGKLSGAQIRDSLAEALKGVDLNTFKINAIAAFDGSEQGARRLAAAISAIDVEVLRRAGTSLDELASGFSKAATSAINDLDALTATVERLKLKGDDVGRALAIALDKALAAAGTERAVQAVIERFEQLGKQGLIAGTQMTEGLEKARAKLDELKPGISSLAEAFKTFGLQTRAEATALAEKYGEAYTQIKNSGTASLAELRKAFEQWSAAAIAANNGVEPYVVKVQRAILDTAEAANRAGTAAEDAGNKTTRAFKGAKEQIDATAGSLDALTAAANRNASVKSVLGTNAYDKSGNALDSSGNLLQITGQVNVPAGYVFDQKAFDRATQFAIDTHGKYPDPAKYYKAPSGSSEAPGTLTGPAKAPAGLLPGGAAGYSPLNANAQKAATTAPPPTVTPSSASSSHTVEIKLQGTAFAPYQSTLVNLSSQYDAASLVTLLKQLDSSARSSGGLL